MWRGILIRGHERGSQGRASLDVLQYPDYSSFTSLIVIVSPGSDFSPGPFAPSDRHLLPQTTPVVDSISEQVSAILMVFWGSRPLSVVSVRVLSSSGFDNRRWLSARCRCLYRCRGGPHPPPPPATCRHRRIRSFRPCSGPWTRDRRVYSVSPSTGPGSVSLGSGVRISDHSKRFTDVEPLRPADGTAIASYHQ